MNESGCTPLFFHCVGDFSWMVIWREFFFICGSCFKLKISQVDFLWNRLQLLSKTDLITSGLILIFLLDCASFSRRQICTDWNLQELLFSVSILRTSSLLKKKDSCKNTPHAVYLRYMHFTCKNRWKYLLLHGMHLMQNRGDSMYQSTKFAGKLT